MPKDEDLVRRIWDAFHSGATRITIEPKPDGDKGALKFMVNVRSLKPEDPKGHSVSPNLAAALDRALSGFEKGPYIETEVLLDAEAESLL